MPPSERELYQDLERLWIATFGEAPPVRAEPSLLLSILIRHLPQAPAYEPGRSWQSDADRSQQDTDPGIDIGGRAGDESKGSVTSPKV